MNHALWTGVSVGVIMALSVVTANAFALTGKVIDDNGKAVQDADVSLVQKGLKAKTDTSVHLRFIRPKNSWLWQAETRSDFSP